MKSNTCRLAVRALEDRSVPSIVAYGDLNHDGLSDMAAITTPTTIVISLANSNGGYTVSATLTTPPSRPMVGVVITDVNNDGNLDVLSTSTGGNNLYLNTWLGEGDGTFGARHTERWHPQPGW